MISRLTRSVRTCSLKSDQWLTQTAASSDGVRGAVGFRQVPNSNIYAIGQPTEDAVEFVLSKVKERTPNATSLLWLNLREEPVVVRMIFLHQPSLGPNAKADTSATPL